MRKINKIIIHCSASPDNRDIGLNEINQWHKDREFSLSESGFFCGYHAVIRRDGTIELARLEDEPGVHCKGDNHDSLGVCLVGMYAYTSSQIKALMALVNGWMIHYDLTPKNVYGHCERPSGISQGKTCPNLGDMEVFREKLEIYYFNQGG